MKRAAEDKPDAKSTRGGIRWDEDNLEENERIKKELNPRKIDEPKTPYLSPLETTDEEGDALGIAPLSLDEDVGIGPSNRPRPPRILTRPPENQSAPAGWSDSSDMNRNSSPVSGSRGPEDASAPPRSSSRSPRFSEDYYGKDDSDEESQGDVEKAEKRRRFREARKAHYRMREVLLSAKDPTDEDEDDVQEGGGADPHLTAAPNGVSKQ